MAIRKVFQTDDFKGTYQQYAKLKGITVSAARRNLERNKVEQIGWEEDIYTVTFQDNTYSGTRYEIADALGVHRSRVSNYHPKSLGVRFLELDEYEPDESKKSIGYVVPKSMRLEQVLEIAGRMKYLNNNGAEPEWTLPLPIQKALDKEGIDYGDIKEIEC